MCSAWMFLVSAFSFFYLLRCNCWNWCLLPLFVWKSRHFYWLQPGCFSSYCLHYLESLVHSCKRGVFVSTPSPALPVKCLEHRGASKVPLSSSHWFSIAVLAQTWLFSLRIVDLELLCSAGASVGHLHICCDVDGVLLLLIYEAIHASFLSPD